MDALLLAGGFGTRLRPLTYTRPKPLVPVAGRPMLEWVLDRLPEDVDRVVVAVNWLAEELERHFRHSGRDIEFQAVRETEPLGTGGAIKNCEEAIGSDRFWVLFSDIVSDLQMASMRDQHLGKDAVASMSLFEVPDPEVHQYGVAAFDDQDETWRITGFVEKPATPAEAPSNWINAGAYLLDRSVLDRIPAGRLCSMEKEVFPGLLEEGVWGFPIEGAWIDVGDPMRLLQATRYLAPDYITGPDSVVAQGAVLADTVTGAGASIMRGAELRRCVLGDDVTVAEGVRLTDCVVGDGEVVEAHADGARIWSRPVPNGYPEKQVGNPLAGV